MRLREREMPLDPEIERELEAIDRALAGRRVDPDLEDLALLAAEIRAERPEPARGGRRRSSTSWRPTDFPRGRPIASGAPHAGRLDAFAGLRRKGARRLIPGVQRRRGLRDRRRCWDLGERRSSRRERAAPRRRPRAGLRPGRARSRPGPREPGYAAERVRTPRAAPGARPAGIGDEPLATSRTPLPSAPWPDRRAASRPATSTSSWPRRPTTSATPRTACSTWSRDHHGFVLSSHVSGRRPRRQGRRARPRQLRPADPGRGAVGGDGRPLGPGPRRLPHRRHPRHHEAVRRRTDKRIDDLTRRARQAAPPARRGHDHHRATEHPGPPADRRGAARGRPQGPRQGAAARPPGARRGRRSSPTSTRASGGAWSIGDAFHDAGRVLTVTAGAALVGGAALLPFALLAALGVAGWRGWVRRQRSRALDGTTPG